MRIAVVKSDKRNWGFWKQKGTGSSWVDRVEERLAVWYWARKRAAG